MSNRRCLTGEANSEYDDFNVNDLIDRGLQKRIDKPWDRSTGVFHPSAMGGCRRALYYDRTNEEPVRAHKPSLEMIFLLGHAIHEAIQELVSEEDDDFSCETRSKDEDLDLSGSIDGLFTVKDWVIEFKTMRPELFRRLTRPLDSHIKQVHVYMWNEDVPRAQIVYIDKSSGARKVFKVYFDADVWSEVLDDINYVNEYIDRGYAPPREINRSFCGNCKFKHVCNPEEDVNW